MILEVEPDARKVDFTFNARSLKFLRVTDARSLKNEWRAQRTTTDDHKFPSLEDLGPLFLAMKRLGWHSLDTNGNTILNNDLVDLGVAFEVQVVIFGTSGMDISVSCVASAAGVTVDPLEPLLSTVSTDD